MSKVAEGGNEMNCDKAQESLSAYLDGEIDPGEAQALEKHLEGCKSCSTELESLRSTVALVHSLPRVQAPSVLSRRVMSASAGRAPERLFPGAMTLLTAAALVLVAVVAVFMLTPRETPPAEVTANGIRAKSALENDAEAPVESQVAQVPGKGWSGTPRKNGIPAAREGLRRRQKGQVHRGADNKFVQKEKPSTDFSRPAPVPPENPAIEKDIDELTQKKLPEQDSAQELELAKRKLVDRMNEALKKDDPAVIEKLAQLKKKTRAGGGQAEGAPRGEKLAEARRHLKEEKLQGAAPEKTPSAGETADEAKDAADSSPVEEIVLEVQDIEVAAEAVAKLAKAYSAKALSDGRMTEDAETGRGGVGEADKVGSGERVLLLQIDRAKLHEFMRNVEELPTARRTRAGRHAAKEEREEKYSQDDRGTEKKAEKHREKDKKKEEERRPGDPKAPLAGEPASPVKPATRPQKPPSEEAGKQTTKAKKKPLKKEAGKQIPGDALEEPPPAPPGPGTRRAGAYGKPTGETVTLRIRIVKSNAPAAELRKPEAAPRKAKPTKSKGK